MDYIILNEQHFPVPSLVEKELLRSSLLFGKKVHLASLISNYIFFFYSTDSFTDEQKLKYYPDLLKRPDSKVDVIQVVKTIEVYIKLKKLKHKNRQQLLDYHQLKKFMAATDAVLKAEIDYDLENYQFDDIKNFYSSDGSNVFINNAFICHDKDLKNFTLRIEYFAKAFIMAIALPVLPVLQNLKNISINNIKDESVIKINEPLNNIIEIELFSFHGLKSLVYNQIKQIREEVEPKVTEFHNSLFEFNKINCLKLFTKDSIEKISEFAGSSSDKLNDIQKILDNNIYLKQASINNPENLRYLMVLNFTSLENIVDIYKECKIISHETSLYIKEEISKLFPLGNLTSFLTIKPI